MATIGTDFCSPFTLRGQRLLNMADVRLESAVEIDDSSETENASKNAKNQVRIPHISTDTSVGSISSVNPSARSENSTVTDFSSFSQNSSGSFRPPLYPFGQGASFPNFSGNVITGQFENSTRPQQQWTPMSNFAAPNPYFGGYFNQIGQFAEHTQQLCQIQQAVKSLEERFTQQASGNSEIATTSSNKQSSEGKSRTAKTHDISDNETIYSDVSSDEGSFGSCSDDESVAISSARPLSFKDLVNKDNESRKNEEKTEEKQNSSKFDKLSKLSQDFETKESYSEKINEKLAKTVNSGMQALFSNSASKDLMNKYNTPENCEWVRVPLINSELWNSDNLQEEYRANDKLFYKNQKLVTKAMLPVIQIMDKCLKQDTDNEIFELACDSFQMLAYAHRDCSNIRRHMLKPAVSKPYRKLCTPSTPVTENLFGDDLHKQIKDLNETKKFTHNLSTQKNKRKSYSYQHGFYKRQKYSDRDYRNDYKKPFLDKRARPYQKKTKNQGAGRKQ